MGKDQRLQSDPARAKPHAKGESVVVIQVLTHAQLGAISYVWPQHWRLHARSAERAANILSKFHKRLVTFPVHDTMRGIEDMGFIETVYSTGVHMVTETILALQHLCQEFERVLGIQLKEHTLDGRLREAMQAAELTPPTKRPGYAKYVELKEIRDAIEHPKSSNVYNGKPGQWDCVPLAWFFSERGLAAFEGSMQFMKSITDDWQERKKQFSGVVELTVQRGRYSERQYKKPPRSASGSEASAHDI